MYDPWKARARGFIFSHLQGKLNIDADRAFKTFSDDLKDMLDRLINSAIYFKVLNALKLDCFASRPGAIEPNAELVDTFFIEMVWA